MTDTSQNAAARFPDLSSLAEHLRKQLEKKKFVLLYAYNGTGKTRLSTAFKDLGKKFDENGEVTERDTLYFNAFTEDLFSWDNDLDEDRERSLQINTKSKFFDGLDTVELDNRIRPLLELYADIQFRINVENWTIHFSREVLEGEGEAARSETIHDIKISRSEESIFLFCFFLAVVEVALDRDLDVYNWAKFIYIDDPISSLDEQNAVLVAVHLAHLLADVEQDMKIVVSTHHPLFYNVLWNELRRVKCKRYFFSFDEGNRAFTLLDTRDTPFFHHVAELIRLYEAEQQGNVEKRHFNTLRAIAERTASFHGYGRFEDCITFDDGVLFGKLYRRFLNLYSHGGYADFEADDLQEEDRAHFGEILRTLLQRFAFNPEHFPGLNESDKQGTQTT